MKAVIASDNTDRRHITPLPIHPKREKEVEERRRLSSSGSSVSSC